MKNFKTSKSLRIFLGIGIPTAAFVIALIFWKIKETPPCIFYELTGLYCVGCGSGRAFLSLLRLDIYAAFRYNPLLVLLLPFLMYYIIKGYISFVFGKDILPFPQINSKWVCMSLLVLIVVYWILRNIPCIPFSYLAPTDLAR